jgi:hypothetical protein
MKAQSLLLLGHKELLKGLSHEMDLALMTCMASSRPIFRCSNDFITQKVYFSRLMPVYVGLIMLAACT